MKRYTNPKPFLLSAPTGLAASLVGGSTIDNAFRIPFTDTSTVYLESLTDQSRHRLISDLRNIELLVIDEISMVGLSKLIQVDNALREAKQLDQLFGGIHCIFFGDFNQIPPVADRSIIYSNELLEAFQFAELEEV